MRLIEKIEAIRREPEAVRMRYVAASVSVVMFFVIALWIFSLASSLQATLPRVSEGTKRLTDSVAPPTSLQNLLESGEKLQENSEQAAQPAAPKDSSIVKQLDPNFGQHPTEDTAPKDSSLPILAPNTPTNSAPQTTPSPTSTNNSAPPSPTENATKSAY